MRILVQRVKEAKVVVAEKEISAIREGFLAFVAFKVGEEEKILEKMADKLLKLRIFPDEEGKTNRSLNDIDGELLCVSQFTLYAETSKGHRPSFISSLKGEEAKPLYDKFLKILAEKSGKEIPSGIFGADMEVHLINDGPFTVLLDSDNW